MRRGDEVAAEWPLHILVHGGVSLVEHTAVFGLHVPEEASKCHGPILPGWRRWKDGVGSDGGEGGTDSQR